MSNALRVLYILGCNEGPSKRYRVFNHINYLKIHNIESEWIWDIHPELQDDEYLKQFSIVVNFRGGYSERIENLFIKCATLEIPTVYDIDDLVYDKTLVDKIDAFRLMGKRDKLNYLEGINSIAKMVLNSDYLTVSTPFLQEHISNFSSKESYLIPFGFNEDQYKLSLVRKIPDSVRFIGYLSGTKTHEKDFREAAQALKKILTEYNDVYLKVIGYLDIDKHLPGLEHKVIQIPFMHWESLVFETSSLYIAIAPFDPLSEFCQSKSDLKFVEPALSKVPVIASPISSFNASIINGISGFIANNDDEWFAAFKALLNDNGLRDKMGQAAYNFVMQHRSPEVIGGIIRDVYLKIIENHKHKSRLIDKQSRLAGADSSQRLRISWIIPQPFEASGGHRNIFRAIKYLSEFGHKCSLHVLPDNHRFSTGRQIREFISREFFDIKADEVCCGVENIGESDVLICTYWTTAYIAKNNETKAKLIVYFLQDFEPMFFPMGLDYVRASATYKFGFYPITSGPWPLKMLKDHYGVSDGTFFRFPIDRNIYYPLSQIDKKDNLKIVYFARPDMPRRCYPLGVEALGIVKERRPDVEIIFYGDHADKFCNIPYEVTKLGMLREISDLGDLYRSAYMGICFSTTNPSLVPFEMMACGCPVVDLEVNGNDVNYGGNKNCILVEPSPQEIANEILNLLDDKNRHSALVSNGLKYSSEFPSEIEMARLIEAAIINQVKERSSLGCVNNG